MKKIVLVIFMFGIPTIGLTHGNSTWGTITELYFGSAGDYLQVTMDVSDSEARCGEPGQPYYLPNDQANETTKEFYKTRVSVLLAAFMSGKQVKFYLTNNNCASNNRPIIQGVQVRK